MSELPNRRIWLEEADEFFEDYPEPAYNKFTLVKEGDLKSRDEMDEEAVLPHMTVSEMLDAAWGVADEDS